MGRFLFSDEKKCQSTGNDTISGRGIGVVSDEPVDVVMVVVVVDT